jgi:hypothetical protein
MSDGANGYVHTPDGLNVAQKIWRIAGDSLADLYPVPNELLQKLYSYLDRLLEASLSAPEPPGHFYISHKRDNYGKYETKYPLEGYIVRFGELTAYRDDSHIAAWQAHDIEGHAWEILTYLWRNTSAATIETLYQKMGYRGIPLDVYVQDLRELAKCGWIEENAGAYRMTAEGKRIREEAEALTDQNFFAPWSCLSEAELEDFRNLATKLCDGLRNK